MKLHHIGIATGDIDKLTVYVEKTIGIAHKSEKIYDEQQQAWLCMLELADGSRLELIEGNAVKRFLKKHINLYHICYEVEDIVQEKENWLSRGGVLVSDEKSAVLFNGRKVVFLMSQIGLVELLQAE